MAARGFKGSLSIGVSLLERFLLDGRRQVAGEIKRERRFRPPPPLRLAALNVFV